MKNNKTVIIIENKNNKILKHINKEYLIETEDCKVKVYDNKLGIWTHSDIKGMFIRIHEYDIKTVTKETIGNILVEIIYKEYITPKVLSIILKELVAIQQYGNL